MRHEVTLDWSVTSGMTVLLKQLIDELASVPGVKVAMLRR